MSKVHPKYSAKINDLCESLFVSDNSEECLQNFAATLSSHNTLSLDEDESGTNIAIILIQIQSNLQLVKNFLAKIDINPSDNVVHQTQQHFQCLHGLINGRVDEQIIKLVLAKGFDPGVFSDASKDVFQVAVEQCQPLSDGKVCYEIDVEENPKHLLDIRAAQLMLRTGKVAGFAENVGMIEAKKIEMILTTGSFPENYQHTVGRNPKGKKIITTESRGVDLEIEDEDDSLHVNMARAYLHQFFRREIPARTTKLQNSPVLLEQLEDQENTPSPSTASSESLVSRLCNALCFWRNR